jgi:hypothetical protein
MFKMIIGAGIVIGLVGFGIIDTQQIQSAGDWVANLFTDDVKPMINDAASSIAEATK